MTGPSVPGLAPGLRGERRAVVTPEIATMHAGGDGVLMAIGMILEMELAAQDSTEPFLPADHTTVGYEICVRHRRPTPVGEWFTVTAELLEVDGRRLDFRVEAPTRASSSARARFAAPSSGGARRNKRARGFDARVARWRFAGTSFAIPSTASETRNLRERE